MEDADQGETAGRPLESRESTLADLVSLCRALNSRQAAYLVVGGFAIRAAGYDRRTMDVDLLIDTSPANESSVFDALATLPDQASIDSAVAQLERAGFRHERFGWSINLKGRSKVSPQLSTEEFYRKFPTRAVPPDVHGILMRVASLEDTLGGKVLAWRDSTRRQSKRLKDLGDIARLVETHPALGRALPADLQAEIEPPKDLQFRT